MHKKELLIQCTVMVEFPVISMSCSRKPIYNPGFIVVERAFSNKSRVMQLAVRSLSIMIMINYLKDMGFA